jgi:hypothetical protein
MQTALDAKSDFRRKKHATNSLSYGKAQNITFVVVVVAKG